MKREEMVARLRHRKEAWDIIVVGGGATGAGVAVDAATRGYSMDMQPPFRKRRIIQEIEYLQARVGQIRTYCVHVNIRHVATLVYR